MPTIKFLDFKKNIQTDSGTNILYLAEGNKFISPPIRCESQKCKKCLIKIGGYGDPSDINEGEQNTLKHMHLDPNNHRLACQTNIISGIMEVNFVNLENS